MSLDTPAKIAILGAGPIGLEAALYARFLGYEVVVFESGEVAENVRRWGHVRMFTPFRMNRSQLGLAAIQAQDEGYHPPREDELLTGNEWIDRYLLPLSQTDLLADHLRLGTRVVNIGKEPLEGEPLEGVERQDLAFRLRVRDVGGHERMELADAVIDAGGVFQQANWLGPSGIPAAGVLAAADQIEYQLPDFSGPARDAYAGKHTLLIGDGSSAATSAVALAKVAREAPGTRVTWITRRDVETSRCGPIDSIPGDALAARVELTRQANELISDPNSGIIHWPATGIEKIESGFTVELSGRHSGSYSFDRIVANIGYRPDTEVYRGLQVDEYYSSEGLKVDEPQSLLLPEPNFYILGAKSYGQRSNFLFSTGLEQIRELFAILGDRAALDLYAVAHRLLR
jgi:thioredoxin reductase